MKKSIIHEIDFTASMLPERVEISSIPIDINGSDLNLCVIGKGPFDPAKKYSMPLPVILTVPHRERLKDGVKKYGEGFIGDYIRKVLAS
jgi:hypothetical protein